MLFIAYISQAQMRRSLQGALATDPVVPERRRRRRRAQRASSPRPRDLPPPACGVRRSSIAV
ncbi:MAG: hypothetical protein Q8K79_12705 [Solirubrobacteraceae bacterium]|nr:hypothetical protein [Solirubrobacteraceae bacterium]